MLVMMCVDCVLHPQWTEDPIAHAAVKHVGIVRVNSSRAEPCPLGCGEYLFAHYPKTKVPRSEMEEHTQSETCVARMALVHKARAECEQYLARKAAAEGGGGEMAGDGI